MSANTHTTEPEERKPPTIADIVREKTGDGALIIDFFTDVMTGRIEGAELCHRIDAAKQLVKYGSKDAAEFLAKYKGVPCGHSINGRPDPTDPCSAEERSLVAVTLNAPPTLTKDFLTVLSGIDEFLMTRLIRAQTVDGVTIIEFLDDVMQDRTDGFKTHHRIAAAKELIVHIVRDEQPEPNTTVVPAEAGTQRGGGARNTPANPAHPEPVLSTAEGPSSSVVPAHTTVVPAEAGTHPRTVVMEEPAPEHPETGTAHTAVVPAKSLPRTRYGAGIQGGGGGRSTAEGSAHPNPSSSVVPANTIVVPAKSLPRTRYGAGTHPRDPEPGSQLETLPARRTRTQRRRDGNARAAIRRKALGSERIEEEKNEKPAPAELTPAERRINEKLKQHWHEPDPYGAPIDSTHPGRSPP